MRGDIPIGRQLNKNKGRRLSLTTSTLSCNALDDRIAALENEIESDSGEEDEDGEEEANRKSSNEGALPSSKSIHVAENIIAETDEYGNVIRLKSSLSGRLFIECRGAVTNFITQTSE